MHTERTNLTPAYAGSATACDALSACGREGRPPVDTRPVSGVRSAGDAKCHHRVAHASPGALTMVGRSAPTWRNRAFTRRPASGGEPLAGGRGTVWHSQNIRKKRADVCPRPRSSLYTTIGRRASRTRSSRDAVKRPARRMQEQRNKFRHVAGVGRACRRERRDPGWHRLQSPCADTPSSGRAGHPRSPRSRRARSR